MEIPIKRPRGRPKGSGKRQIEQRKAALGALPKPLNKDEYSPTEDDREKVEILAAAGYSDTEIANAMSITVTALHQYFHFEIATRGGRRNAAMVIRLYKAGIKGNVPAMKAWLSRVEALLPTAPPPAAEPKPPKLGKKELAQLEAETALDDPPPDAELAAELSGWSNLIKH